MASGNDRRSKVLVLDADHARAAELGRRIEFLDYEPVPLTGTDASPDEESAAEASSGEDGEELKA